ncbi:MAG: glycosyltransferase family 2 protein [Candidatus Didemnitutus sp.]|nr:glycosyltransferase family 2 protein [Candidatus Didemnitutus sp.]
MSSAAPELSIVIPFHNEGPNVAALLAELEAAVVALGVPAEVIAVDDGSRDDTGTQLDNAALRRSFLRVLRLPKNGGQAAALLAGFAAARAPWIAMMDGDGQNPPAELPKLWAARESADMIIGYRAARHDSWLRRTMSRVANAVRRSLLRDGARDTGCSLKLFRREVLGSFLPLRTLYSFLPAFAVWNGWRVREIPVDHRPRRAGRSHYGLGVMFWRPFFDLLALSWILRRQLPRAVRPPSDPTAAGRH